MSSVTEKLADLVIILDIKLATFVHQPAWGYSAEAARPAIYGSSVKAAVSTLNPLLMLKQLPGEQWITVGHCAN